jgi:hypothetical protein
MTHTDVTCEWAYNLEILIELNIFFVQVSF